LRPAHTSSIHSICPSIVHPHYLLNPKSVPNFYLMLPCMRERDNSLILDKGPRRNQLNTHMELQIKYKMVTNTGTQKSLWLYLASLILMLDFLHCRENSEICQSNNFGPHLEEDWIEWALKWYQLLQLLQKNSLIVDHTKLNECSPAPAQQLFSPLC